EDRFRLRRERRAERFRIARIRPFHVPVEFGESLAELVDRTAIELARSNDLVAGLHQRMHNDELCGVARRDRESRAAALERGDALLEDRVRGVRDSRIDVSEDLEIEQGR